MKKNIIYISALAFALLLSACERVEEIDAPVSGKMEEMKFFASIESGADTKTMIDGNVGDETRYLKWLPGDAIGVYNGSSRKFEKFVNVNAETSASGVFEGANTVQDVYYAVYPYSELHSYADRDKTMTLELPAVQNYAENTFGNGANPMVAHAESGEELMFQNLCGVLVINLTGSVTVKSMSVTLLDESGNHAPVSGKHTVLMDYIEEPSLKSTEESTRSVTLDCGEGVALNAAEPTPFHIVVPAGTYSGVTLSVVTADGQMMVKQGKNQLKIRRRRVTSAGALGWEAVVSVDLSERGTSNCYIVSEPGVYSFDATVIGNGGFGLVSDAGFHTDDVKISPAFVELLWEDKPCLVQSPFVFDGKIYFYSSGMEGNALIAAKDESGNIIWSWHIWTTDEPETQIYENADNQQFVVMDRNLGAVHNRMSDKKEEIIGLFYQWGRKDPLLTNNYISYDVTGSGLIIAESVSNPTLLPYNRYVSPPSYDWDWMTPSNVKLWKEGMKTVYDPCPVGYRITDPNIFAFTSDNISEKENGYEYLYDGSNVSSFPYTGFSRGNGTLEDNTGSYLWTSVYKTSVEVSHNLTGLNTLYRSIVAMPVRCMKDDGYVDTSLPQIDLVTFSELTESSVKIVANVVSEGASDVTERGVIWGADPELSDGVKVSCGSGTGEFSCDLTGLESGSSYYAKAYAVNDHGESHSDVRVFSTRYSNEDAVDLSIYETANSYIVSSPGLYIINCLVKGNSTESVGTPVSAAVVWETKNTDAPVTTGDIIDNVELHGGYLSFEIPMPFTQGNALVAVKDASGNILWSWHIWVTDFDPDVTVQTYISGAKMMDRNLGALDAGKTSTAYGFLYQWGRKDPLLTSATGGTEFAVTAPENVKKFADSVSGDKLEYSIQNPTHSINDLYNADLAWASEKTMYDPCPAGWRVPDGGPDGVWKGIFWEGISSGADVGSTYWVISEQYSTPSAVYPAPGYTGADRLDLDYPGSALYCWSCTPAGGNEAYGMHLFNRIERELIAGKASEFSVRCMKE